MCGIVGIIDTTPGRFTQSIINQFNIMLVVNTLRGIDGTGAFYVGKNGETKSAKTKELAYYLFGNKQYEKLTEATIRDGRALVGHCRSATKGKISDDNSHPFTKEGITLVHNGTLQTWQPHVKDMDKFDVDSEWLCNKIHELGAESALSQIKGAMAIIFYDKSTPDILYAYRNSERPLFILREAEGKRLYFNSCPYALMFLKGKERMDGKEYPQPLDENVLYKFNIENGEWSSKKIEMKPDTSYSGAGYRGYDDYPEYSGHNIRKRNNNVSHHENCACKRCLDAIEGDLLGNTPFAGVGSKVNYAWAKPKPILPISQQHLLNSGRNTLLLPSKIDSSKDLRYEEGSIIKMELGDIQVRPTEPEFAMINLIPCDLDKDIKIVCRTKFFFNENIPDEKALVKVLEFEGRIDKIVGFGTKEKRKHYDFIFWMADVTPSLLSTVTPESVSNSSWNQTLKEMGQRPLNAAGDVVLH